MPDMERLHRDLAIHLATDFKPERVPILQAEFRGEDRARKQIAYFFGYLAAVIHLLCYLFARV